MFIKENSGFGVWGWDILANEWDVKNFNDWGVDLPEFEPLDADVKETVDNNDGDKCPECGRKL